MNESEDRERDDDLVDLVAKLRALRDTPAPPDLEARIVEPLRASGALRRGASTSWILRMIAAAACVLIGIVVGRVTAAHAPAPGAPMQSDFAMLLLAPEHADPRYTAGTPAQIFEQYAAWGQEHGQRGELVLGEKLADERLLITEGDRATPLPPSTVDAVEGLFLIRAASIEQARAIVATCPHVLRGGRVELRKIDGP